MNNPKYNLISNSYEEDGIEEVLYYKIVNKDDSKLQDYFNASWYADRKNGVFQLKSTNKDDNNALKVIGKGNNWRIEYKGMNAFKEEGKYDSGKKTWIIVKIVQKENEEGLIFYCDDLSHVKDEEDFFLVVLCVWSVKVSKFLQLILSY